MSNTKKLLFPAVAGAVAMIGAMNEGYGACESALAQVNSTQSSSTMVVSAGNAAGGAITLGVASAETVSISAICSSASDSTAPGVSATGIVDACTSPLKTLSIWVTQSHAANDAGSSPTVTLGASAAMPGTTINIYDATGTAAGLDVTLTAMTLGFGALSADDQIKIAPKDCMINYFGPIQPADFTTEAIAGVKYKFKKKTTAEVLAMLQKRL